LTGFNTIFDHLVVDYFFKGDNDVCTLNIASSGYPKTERCFIEFGIWLQYPCYSWYFYRVC